MGTKPKLPVGVKSRDAYHHGDLCEAAIRTALRVVEENGHDAIVMRNVADAVGVTPMALYRHFENRLALLAAVRRVGHAMLFELHIRASKADKRPRQALAASMRAFLQFADEHPRLFTLIYDPEVVGTSQEEGGSNEGPVYRAIGSLLREALPGASEDFIRLREITMWSTIYGYAVIRVNHLLRTYMLEGLQDSEVIDAVIQAALAGI